MSDAAVALVYKAPAVTEESAVPATPNTAASVNDMMFYYPNDDEQVIGFW